MSDLLVIVPSRGRPESTSRVVDAWRATGAFDDGAQLCFAIDADDPTYDAYLDRLLAHSDSKQWLHLWTFDAWRPMVPKLNEVTADYARRGEHFALGFAGDDHLPRTPGWAGAYLDALCELGTGIVYGDDGIQGQRLPTQWAMTCDIIRALGRMVPAPVEHLYCDNAIKDLGEEACCLRYLPDVLIEHMHPTVGKGVMDAGYHRVNRSEQYRRDRLAYELWGREGLASDVRAVRTIRERTGAR